MDHISTVDRISGLPWDILDNILGHLPIEDVVRTSFLSRKWREKWVDVSKLLFADYSMGDYFEKGAKLVKLVYHVLLSHRGQIDKFNFCTPSIADADCFSDWILVLSRNGIKELMIEITYKGRYHELPSCLYSCQQLIHLHLTNCSVVTPYTSNGFGNLVSLQLKRFSADDKVLERLIRNCPILEKLILSDYDVSHCLTICAPNLKSLYLEGELKDIYLENSPHLTDATFKMATHYMSVEDAVQMMAHNPVGPPGCQSPFRRLTFTGDFLRFLATRCILQGVPTACEHLKVVELSEVHFAEVDEILVTLSILRSSSNLKELCISVSGEFKKDAYEFMRAEAQLNFCFNQLQVVKIDIFGIKRDKAQRWRSDLEFIKLVLASSPVLEKMLVNYTYQEDSDLWFMKQLLSFERASAQLIFKYSSINCFLNNLYNYDYEGNY